jgi:glycosyltransferase involved in cell wall biosynthesis
MQNLSVLVIHNQYQQAGGEDSAVQAELSLLRQHGHPVLHYTRHNLDIAAYGAARKSSLLLSTSWNARSYAEIRELIRKHKPDVAHCHNLLPLVSPAAYYACKSAGIPVVQTLHNYRLVCPAGTLFRNGQRCNGCAEGTLPGAFSSCYRNSRIQTAAVSLMLGAHRLAGTWKRSVDAYLTPSQFCRDTFIRSGLPAEKVHCRPNFLARDPAPRSSTREYALFVGRLSPEKGVLEMLQAWRVLPHVPLLVAGGGPLYTQACRQVASANLPVKLLGQIGREPTLTLMRGSSFLVFPSRWYEPFGMALLESAACGVPAIASRIGAIPEIVTDQQTGLLFDPDNFGEMTEHVRWAWRHPTEMEYMGDAARRRYLSTFTAEKNYETLMKIYNTALTN